LNEQLSEFSFALMGYICKKEMIIRNTVTKWGWDHFPAFSALVGTGPAACLGERYGLWEISPGLKAVQV
jgi:hypothetical protein